jgi:hypothetical protein
VQWTKNIFRKKISQIMTPLLRKLHYRVANSNLVPGKLRGEHHCGKKQNRCWKMIMSELKEPPYMDTTQAFLLF